MVSRPPSAPPELPGYSYVRHIGGGGFADVFLYEQQALGRSVAVKVLLASESSPSVRAQFDAESTLMAALSTHPHIVSIYDASIASDGRPYLIMEYCSRPNLSERYKSEHIGVQDVAAIGVQLGGAIETAHRAGILHRDIKPANVLTTDYNRPALTDFGISVAAGTASDGDTVGMSIPWSPPEMLSDEPDGDQRADVYSLSATLYTLLARRSPYERPGGPNSAVDLVNRIQRAALPPVGRSDVPPSLERVLARGLAKNAGARWTSALQLARALQDVQSEQGWAVTAVDVFDENPVAAQAALPPEDDGRTRIRGLTTIHPQLPVERTGTRTQRAGAHLPGPQLTHPLQFAVEGTQLRSASPDFLRSEHPAAPTPADTVMRPADPQGPFEPAAPTEPRRRWPWIVAAAVMVAVVATVAIILTTRGAAPAALPTDGPDTPTGQAVDLGVPEPADLSVVRKDDAWVFSWRNPDPAAGDTFHWKRTDTATDHDAQTATEPTALVRADRACIQVILVRDNGEASNPATLCSNGG